MGIMNRLANCHNQYQGNYKKVLCVCSAGLLRSPTAAFVLSQEPFNYNTRACGIDEGFALIPLDTVLLHWADEVVCMDEYQEKEIRERLDLEELEKTPVICLHIGDSYSYRETELVQRIRDNYTKALTKV